MFLKLASFSVFIMQSNSFPNDMQAVDLKGICASSKFLKDSVHCNVVENSRLLLKFSHSMPDMHLMC